MDGANKLTIKLGKRFNLMIMRYKLYVTLNSLIPSVKMQNKLSNRISNSLDKKLLKVDKYIKIK